MRWLEILCLMSWSWRKAGLRLSCLQRCLRLFSSLECMQEWPNGLGDVRLPLPVLKQVELFLLHQCWNHPHQHRLEPLGSWDPPASILPKWSNTNYDAIAGPKSFGMVASPFFRSLPPSHSGMNLWRQTHWATEATEGGSWCWGKLASTLVIALMFKSIFCNNILVFQNWYLLFIIRLTLVHWLNTTVLSIICTRKMGRRSCHSTTFINVPRRGFNDFLRHSHSRGGWEGMSWPAWG